MNESDGSRHVAARLLVELGGAMLGDDTVDELVDRIVRVAAQAIPAAWAVSVSVVEAGAVRTPHASLAPARALDEAQYAGSAGPCVEAIRTNERVVTETCRDMARWPMFSARAEAFAVSATLSTPLRAKGQTMGALNVYSRGAEGFSATEVTTAQLLADQAGVLLANTVAYIGATTLNDQLREALASREVIGEAKGILIEREGCDRDRAFDILRRASQRENRKLREIAEDIVTRAERRAAGAAKVAGPP